jgi:putative hydrolase of the HAD superfamily
VTRAGRTAVYDAVVFDLLYTLVHPGIYPGGVGRIGWLANLTGIDEVALRDRWRVFEQELESGAVGPGPSGRAPEIEWVASVCTELGHSCSEATLGLVQAQWDLTRRTALLSPHPAALPTIAAMRDRGLRVGVLSNTHAMEIRAWRESPLAMAVDAVAFSHVIRAMKPEPAAYDAILRQLGAAPDRSVFIGDGGSDELSGARDFGFALVVLAEESPRRLAPLTLPRLREQAHVSVSDLSEIPGILWAAGDC